MRKNQKADQIYCDENKEQPYTPVFFNLEVRANGIAKGAWLDITSG